MKIVCVSDIHGLYDEVNIPEGDILINAGDSLNCGNKTELQSYVKFLDNLKFKTVITIAGNHDCIMQDKNQTKEILEGHSIYLEDEDVIINGLRIWGSPWTLKFNDWAFMLTEKELSEKYNIIPKVDILVTHGPPYQIMDKAKFGNSGNLGSRALKTLVNRINPAYHVFGHIHGSRGKIINNKTTFINAAVIDDMYTNMSNPIVIEI